MKTTALLHNLSPYLALLLQLQQKEKDTLLKWKLVSQYSFIILDLQKEEEEKTELYLQITLEVRDKEVVLTQLYCEQDDRRGEWETFVHHHVSLQKPSWEAHGEASVYLDESFSHYLDIADSIASVGSHCSSGDDYRPGFYSTVTLTEDEVILSQINLLNSRSLSHKDDYHMRKLEMRLPLPGKQSATLRHDHQIGDLRISFSDSSSKHNRSCGDAILLKIITLKGAFDSLP